MSSVAEIQARRDARKAQAAAAREEQYAKDLEALDAAEVEYGDGLVAKLETSGYVPGLPTLVVVKAPSGEYYKRFCQQVRKAGTSNMEARGAAQDMLADVCWVYPKEDEARKAMLASFPGLLVSVAVQAAKLAEFKADEEGKG